MRWRCLVSCPLKGARIMTPLSSPAMESVAAQRTVSPAEAPVPAAGERAARVPARELAAVLGLMILADITIYRGQGFAGMAALFSVAPALLLWGAPHRRRRLDLWIVAAMLLLLAAALVWCGTAGQ